jgi:hypothetical protein
MEVMRSQAYITDGISLIQIIFPCQCFFEVLLGDGLFDHIINQPDDDRFERVAAKINSMSDRTVADDGKRDRIKLIDQIYKRIINSYKERQL